MGDLNVLLGQLVEAETPTQALATIPRQTVPERVWRRNWNTETARVWRPGWNTEEEFDDALPLELLTMTDSEISAHADSMIRATFAKIIAPAAALPRSLRKRMKREALPSVIDGRSYPVPPGE